MPGLLNSKWSEIGHLFCIIFVLYLGREIFRPVSGFGFLQIGFLGEVSSSQIER